MSMGRKVGIEILFISFLLGGGVGFFYYIRFFLVTPPVVPYQLYSSPKFLSRYSLPQIILYEWRRNDLLHVGFKEMQYYIVSLDAFKNYLIVSDYQMAIQVLRWKVWVDQVDFIS